jgi:hypothetical protein
MSELHEIVDWPDEAEGAEGPVLVAALDGWIDAGFAGAGAMQHLLDVVDTTLVASFDVETLVDYRARRPIVHLVDGVNTRLTWPVLELRHGYDADGQPVLLLAGAEPDVRWRQFVDEVVGLSLQLGTRLFLGMAGYPAAVPHTRPVRLSATASNAQAAASAGGSRSTLDVPGGVLAALEHRFGELSVDAVTTWAQVPHYAAGMPSPTSSFALLESVRQLGGPRVDLDRYSAASAELRARLDQLVAANPEHRSMVSQLEARYDDEAREHAEHTSPGDLADEVERFLREVGGDG